MEIGLEKADFFMPRKTPVQASGKMVLNHEKERNVNNFI